MLTAAGTYCLPQGPRPLGWLALDTGKDAKAVASRVIPLFVRLDASALNFWIS